MPLNSAHSPVDDSSLSHHILLTTSCVHVKGDYGKAKHGRDLATAMADLEFETYTSSLNETILVGPKATTRGSDVDYWCVPELEARYSGFYSQEIVQDSLLSVFFLCLRLGKTASP